MANGSADGELGRSDDVVHRRLSRRAVLAGGAALPLASLLCEDEVDAAPKTGLLSFASVPISKEDTLVVPEGYAFEVVNAWGDPAKPTAVSAWPTGGRPRSALVAIRRKNGGLIGT
jgi:secreted PhoX family phosphatase